MAATTVVAAEVDPSGTVSAGPTGYVLDGRLNDSFKAVNGLLASGASVRRADRDGDGFNTGDFLVGPSANGSLVRELAEETGVQFTPLASDATGASYALVPQRIGMYQRYYGGNMDEGWTRWLLEDFGFAYTSIMDEEILRGRLHERWDVIILPADSKNMMTGERGGDGGGFGGGAADTPPDYRSGFGDAGVAALQAFVESGGTLVTFARPATSCSTSSPCRCATPSRACPATTSGRRAPR
jgi:hypothetical protein